MATTIDYEPLTKAWGKIIGGDGQFADVGRAGYIPVYDQNYEMWRLFRNTHTIYEGAENVADPVKVEDLRSNAANLISHYPQTIELLEKYGVRVKRLLSTTIKTPEDVATWATSIFNVGPTLNPEHVWHTAAIAYDDFVMRISQGRGLPPIFLVPAGPRGSGNKATIDFTVPGRKSQYGPRHEYSKTAFAGQDAKPAVEPVAKESAVEAPVKPRGRPRADGLTPGSPEAKAADAIKRRQARVAARAKAKAEAELAPIIPISTPEPPRRRLIRRRRSS